MSDGGKGSKPRPFSISHEEWNSRWDAIFQRDLPKETSAEGSAPTEDSLRSNHETQEAYKSQQK